MTSRCALLTVLAVLLVALPASADPVIGVGEQYPQMFSSPYYQALGIHDARVVVAWDALGSAWQRHELDAWMAAATASNTNVLIAITRSRRDDRHKFLPSPARYRAEFRHFRKRYPQVSAYIPWNEANHCSQPTCNRPEVAARYYDIMRSVCHSCTVVAADVLDMPGMTTWLKRFRHAVKHSPTVWGLHNYLDANRFRSDGTKEMLRTVKGKIWFTETGGLVRRANHSSIRFPDSISHAAKAVKWVLKLATLSSRIQRVYFYHWSPAPAVGGVAAPWDSALTDSKGRPRPAYKVLRSYVRKAEARRAQRAAQAAGQ